jgi:hypothetical protein
MKNLKKAIVMIIISLAVVSNSYAQDPRLPSVNLGYTNMQAGKSRPPGLYYIQYIQVFQPREFKAADGQKIENAPLNSSLVTLQQIAYISESKVLGGNIGFTVLFPLVKVTPDAKNVGVSSNPNPIGDVVAGSFIQWYNKEIFGLTLSHRFGVNFSLPTGSFDQQYTINTGSHRFRIFPHYEFTVNPVKNVAVSIKNNFYYNFKEIGSPNQPAIAYNLNYALEFTVAKRLVVEAAGYYLTQFNQDKYNGDDHFYYNTYGITDTRERVFGIGPGIGYTTPSGLSLELKNMWETAGRNRAEGSRTTLLLSYKLF